MTAVRLGRMPGWAAPAIGAGALAVAMAATARGADHYPLLITLAGLLTAISLVFLAWWSDPAWSFSGVVVCSIFSGQWAYVGLPIGPDRILFVIGCMALLTRAPGCRDRPAIPWRGVHWILAAVAVYGISSSVIGGSFGHKPAFYGLLDRLGIVPFACFALAPVVFRTARQRAILLASLVGTGIYLGATALFETIGLRALVFPAYILDPSLGIHFGRARGPFLEAAANGLAMYACAVAGAIAFMTWKGNRARAVAAASSLLCLLGTALTLTRAIWLATIIATLLTLAIVPALRRFLIPVVGGLVILAVGALTLIPSFQEQAQSREAEKIPIWDRLNTNHAAINMIEQQPLFGFGWGNFPEKSPPYFDQAANYPLTGVGLNVHNVFLSHAVELGLLGALLWGIGFIGAIGGALVYRGPPELAAWRVGLIAIAANFIVVANFVPLSFAFPNMLLWLWAGIVIGPKWGVREPASSSEGPS
jgi:O-antigen ligase